MTEQESDTRYNLICHLPLAGILVYLLIQSLRMPVGDFGNYYYASKFLTEGRWNLWIYDPAAFNLAVYEAGQRNFFLNYTPVPPLSALLYVPFSWLGPVTAKLCWNLISSVLLIITVSRLRQQFNLPYLLFTIVPVLFFVPFRSIINEGQSYFLVLFLLVEGLTRYRQDQRWTAALLWALAIHLKISPAFIFLFLLSGRDFKTTARLMVCTIGLMVISIPAIHLETWSNYTVHILPRLFNGEINNTYALNYQSMQVLLKILLVPDAMHNPRAYSDHPALYKMLLWGFNLIIYGLALLVSFSDEKVENKFCVWLVVSLLVSGYGNSFSLVFFLIPMCCYYHFLKDRRLLILAVLLVFLVNALPIGWFNALPVPLRFPRLYLLLLLFIALVLFAKITIKPYFMIIPCMVFFIPFNETTYRQNYLLDKEEALLIYDYSIERDSIAIHFFDREGPRLKKIKLPFAAQTTSCNDTFRSITIENTRKECLVNDSVHIYLSDKNRGVGFYTLRQVGL